MKPVLVIYATREGQTRRIAEHVGATLAARQCSFELVDAAHMPEEFSMGDYSAAIVCASLHAGKHEREMKKFVKLHLKELQEISTLFLSVSLSEVTVEDPKATPERRAEAEADVKRTIELFLRETGWHPAHFAGVAGALRYSKYNFAIRFVMKRIAKKAGGPVDTSRDYEFTNWPKLDGLVSELARATISPAFPQDAPAPPAWPDSHSFLPADSVPGLPTSRLR